LGTLAVAALTVLAAGCASSGMTHWTGLDISQVAKKFGPATRTLPSGDGAVYVWEQTKSTAGTPGGGPTGATTDHGGLPSSNLLYLRWRFVVDHRGTILGWSVRESSDPRWVDLESSRAN
jgi:hypothetical protein